MEISPWLVYAITRLDALGFMLGLTTILIGVWGVACFMVGTEETKEVRESWWKKSRRLFALALVLIPINGLIPNARDAVAIYLIPKLANSQVAHNLAGATDSASKLLKYKLDEWVRKQMGNEHKEKE